MSARLALPCIVVDQFGGREISLIQITASPRSKATSCRRHRHPLVHINFGLQWTGCIRYQKAPRIHYSQLSPSLSQSPENKPISQVIAVRRFRSIPPCGYIVMALGVLHMLARIISDLPLEYLQRRLGILR